MPNMVNAELYVYTAADNILGDASLMPFLPVTLASEGHTLDASGLLDTGSSVNVLPYSMGMQLGAIWESQPILVRGHDIVNKIYTSITLIWVTTS